jgi:hypothetical protein
VTSNDDVSLSDRTSSVIFSATAGSTYQIAVDGYNGAAGNVSAQAYKQERYKVRVKKGKKKRWVWRSRWVPITTASSTGGEAQQSDKS